MLPSVLRRHRHSLLAKAAAAAAAPSSHPELSLFSPLLSPQHGWQGQGSHSQPGCGQGQQQQEGEQEGSLAGGLHGCQPHLHAPRALHTSRSSSCSAGSWGSSSRRGDRGSALASSPAARGLATLAPDRVTALATALNAPPHSLHHARPPPIPQDLESTFLGRLALKVLMYNDTKNQLIISGQLLYEDVKEQVDDGALQQAFGMDPKIFYSTFTLLSLHVWLIIHRLGVQPDSNTQFFIQRFYAQFQADVERRIYAAGVQVGVSKWTKKLENVFYSSSLAFDRVIFGEGNDTFEDIILREFFGADTTKRVQAQLLAKYLQYESNCLKMTDTEVILKGHIQFSQAPFEGIRANMLRERLHAAQGGQLSQV